MSLTNVGLKVILFNAGTYEANDGLGVTRDTLMGSFSGSLTVGRA
jgi:hypothetical protein